MKHLKLGLSEILDLMYTTINETSKISQAELYRYLEILTEWESNKIYLVLDEIDYYLEHGFMDLKCQECLQIYNDMGWQIPTHLANNQQEMDICEML